MTLHNQFLQSTTISVLVILTKYFSAIQSEAATPEEYLAALLEDRKKIIRDIRKTILHNLPSGFEEQISYGVLSYVVPHCLYPEGYHCDPKLPLPFINLASQKNYISIYHSGLYAGKLLDWLLKEWSNRSDKKPDMGKCCIRFKKPEDVPLDLIGQCCAKITPTEWISIYKSNRKESKAN